MMAMRVKIYSTLFLCSVVCCSGTILQAADQQTTKKHSDNVRLTLPKVMYGVVGLEMNIYFDNVALMVNERNYLFDVTCKIGRQQVERWTYTPTEQDVGKVKFQLDVRNSENKLIATQSCQLVIVNGHQQKKSEDIQTSLLMIGDSLTSASVYPQRMIDLSRSRKYPQLHCIGTTGPRRTAGKINRHEGYGGWTARRFVTLYNAIPEKKGERKNSSPFLFPDAAGKPQLDFKKYCQENNQGVAPDFVTIFLGPNDTFRATDETIEEVIDDVLLNFDHLIKMVQTVNPSTTIGIMLPVPPAKNQDAFGANYSSLYTRWQYRRNQHRLVERMLKKYSNREQEHISIVATHLNLDTFHNYPQVKVNANVHSSTKVVRLANGVHPASSGYFQIGDTLYAWMCGQIADK